jgi:hypothetical protein|tara:strand:- start:274 stop:429 length:156 start_codon:yes stop_codon:yes gene_type:complete
MAVLAEVLVLRMTELLQIPERVLLVKVIEGVLVQEILTWVAAVLVEGVLEV